MYGCCHITPDLIRNSALKALYLFQPKFPPRAERGTGEAGGRDHPHPRPPHPWFCLPPLVSSPSVGNWLSKDQPRAGSGLGLGSTSGLGTLTPRAAALPPPPPFTARHLPRCPLPWRAGTVSCWRTLSNWCWSAAGARSICYGTVPPV